MILAGGQSSRMGKDKANLSFHGKTFQEHAISLLNETCQAFSLRNFEVVVSGQRGIADKFPMSGPLGGIHAVLSDRLTQEKGHILLVVPVDMPLLKASSLVRLLEVWELGGSAAYEITPLPCVVECSRDVLLLAEELLKREKIPSLKTFLDHLNCTYLSHSADLSRQFSNCNTPDEYSDFLSSEER